MESLTLIIHTDHEPDKRQEIPETGLVIGRDASSQVVVRDAILSRQHLRIEKQGGRWIVSDLESRNGTFLNGTRIMASPLRRGDKIQVGTVTLTVADIPTDDGADAFANATQPLPALPPIPPVPQTRGASATGMVCYCSQCGKPVPAGARFCADCGHAAAIPGICSQCGMKLPDGAKFCARCGAVSGGAACPAPSGEGYVTPPNPPRSVGWMFFWSFMWPGLGQLLCGQKEKGALLMIVSVIFNLITADAPGFGLIVFPLWIANLFDISRVAHALREGKPVRHWEFFPG